MSDTEIAIVLGTRPEIIKLAPVIRACESQDVQYTVIHTGQHYSEELDAVFFEQLELPEPDYNLGVGSNSHGVQTAEMLVGIEEILQDEEPETVLVQGDTNSVLAGAIATSKLDMELGHVEAGLRSFDRDMPEEINRVVTDHAADYLFAPTVDSADLIREEGIPEDRIYVTGNTVVDAVEQHREFAQEKSAILDELELVPSEFVLVTAHRAENVDDEDRFEEILDGIARVADRFDVDAVYPIHPRAENRLDEFDISVPDSIRLVEPQDYLDFLNLESNARLILTDSGGVQEEACILGVPCVTMRDNTERPETIDVGANTLAGAETDEIVDSAIEMDGAVCDWTNPFGDGEAGEQIITEVEQSETPKELEMTPQ
ncbi:UDP-N-acetylglucosamine 2-epimerase (non-hydrolysing) [Haladaptatus litoreus]|uniref:UDP-N-acetylglucosamine 2-epimerase (Non-hydrolysing) n=1 Tax=Haladaptatus litoreus TaxID=553468 RepID=A0A1N7DLH9_9EURY|nr:UDP-N-acetylglucosamine 2-epimerase (non-hydrolyzing) [Haladaptatus litoreus]SIR76621.1 UDP-N-acetylglucosamine 2-epimerase (non-hydrolysing) [Haladaptatus litoreus]